jgi:hypothetical protein
MLPKGNKKGNKWKHAFSGLNGAEKSSRVVYVAAYGWRTAHYV